MHKIMFAFAFLGISLCVGGGEYLIEISPSIEESHYEMKTGDVVAFEVTAYERGESSNILVELEEKIWWEYDKRLLEKVSSDDRSIRLKAIREGVTELGATTIIRNNHCQKKINISIIK